MNSLSATQTTAPNLTGATLEPFQNNASALEVETATHDTGVLQFVPNTILQVDGSLLSDMPMERLRSLLLEVYDHTVPGEGIEELALVVALLATNEGGGDATLQDLRKRRTIVGRAFEFLVASATTSGASRWGMRRATLSDSTYLLLLLWLQMTRPAASTPTHLLATTTYTVSPAAAPPPSTSALGKDGRGSDTNFETDDKGDDGGATPSHASGL